MEYRSCWLLIVRYGLHRSEAALRLGQEQNQPDRPRLVGLQLHLDALQPRKLPGHVKPYPDPRTTLGIAPPEIALEQGRALGWVIQCSRVDYGACDLVA